MQWVKDHLTVHHFFHAPHRWFWAVVLSPLHAAELHYQRRYHLTFVHAKKLFFFDMALLFSVVFLAAGSTIGALYDPTITDTITLTIHASKDRIAAGEQVEYHIDYHNTSEQTLENVLMALHLPSGFSINAVDPQHAFDANARTVNLGTLAAGANGTVHVRGWFYGSPEQEDAFTTTLSYNQKQNTEREQKIARVFTTLRGSTLHAELTIADTILANGNTPFSLTLTSDPETPLYDVTVPLALGSHMRIDRDATSTTGTLTDAAWHIHRDSGSGSITTATLTGILNTSLPQTVATTDILFTPIISVSGKKFAQTPVKKTVSVIHPTLAITSQWNGEQSALQPGQTGTLTLLIKNTGTTSLTDLEVRIPLPPIINAEAARKENGGQLEKNVLVLTPARHAELTSLPPDKSVALTLNFPIKSSVTESENINLDIHPNVSARIPSISTRYTASATTPKIKIGTNLTVDAALRYFTEEGDQLGRGPLPPQVAKETKYWAFIRISNTTSEVKDLALTATLPPNVRWTGKSSISQGAEPIYTATNRTLRWSTALIPSHTQAGVYLELAFIPEASQIGKSPALLSHIMVQGQDTYINLPVTASYSPLDITVPRDAEAKKEGIKVLP